MESDETTRQRIRDSIEAVGGVIPSGVLKGRTLATARRVGDACGVCEGPCRYGNCSRCGGHSEHNAGCDLLTLL